jgi:hypothetical protein
MKRSVSFYESRIALNEEQQAAIRAKLGANADDFIAKAVLAGGEYQQLAAAWSGPSPADVRTLIEKLGAACATATEAIESLSDAAPGLIRQAQALDASEAASAELSASLATSLEDLQIHLRRIESACSRSAKFKALNRGQGNTGDDARRSLIAQLGQAYLDATGKAPARSRSGTFAAVATIVLKAAGANFGLSNDLLVSILGPSGKSS